MTASMAARTYTDDEVKDILARAVERAEEDRTKLSLDDLADIGQELGLSREAIERAAREVESASAPKSAAELSPVALAGDEALAKHKKRERKKLLRRVLTYGAVISFCAFINIKTGGQLWVQWLAAGWGLALLIGVVKDLTRDDDELREQLALGLSKRERKELRKEARRARKLSEPERVRVDAAVERVVKHERLRVPSNESEPAHDRGEAEERARRSAKLR
jgi:hypothetical protein